MTTYIAYLMFIAFFLAICHFIVEAIIVPSVRWSYRLEVFQLRDRLRMLQLGYPNDISKEAFQALESGVNNALSLIKVFDFWFAYKTNTYVQSDPELEKRLERRYQAATECKNAEFQAIASRLNSILTATMIWNTAGWFIYIVPLVYALFAIGQMAGWIRRSFMLISPSDLSNVSQSSGLAIEPAH